VALVNSTIDTLGKKTLAKKKDRQSLVYSAFTTFSQEKERIYSFNPGARTWRMTYAPGWRNALRQQRVMPPRKEFWINDEKKIKKRRNRCRNL